ncbi:MAG: MFS transporter [Xanthomonadales bacterium]|nr:MFS transporter [Xanthomonadales bacterium]MBK7144080.1 MFS transporter [Xanthomonadales bacterium]MCC6560561.1 MFS transporter [Xanthomonadales bacterium]
MRSASEVEPGWRRVLRGLRQPRTLIMLMLGFSSGLPFMLVGNTLGYWLREVGIELTTIGFLSWVGLCYSLKFLWAPLIDRIQVPLLGSWFGLRRGWMLLSQALVMLAFLAMSAIGPGPQQLVWFGAFALLAAFASATQDIVIDAWRIETCEDHEAMALLSSAAQLGYRAALLLADAWILVIAAGVGWALSYQTMAALMMVGMLAVWWATEPVAVTRNRATLLSARALGDAIAGPFIAFFQTHGVHALWMLAAISLYRLPDFVMGPMANPLYADLGLDKEMVGAVRGSVGLVASLAGIATAGVFALRFGFVPTLLLGAVLGPGSNLAFSWLAWSGGDPAVFSATMAIDNYSAGFAGAALVAYMSSLTSLGYTASQYALLSSFYALLGKVLKGFSGIAVEGLQHGRTLIDAYAIFFVGTALIGVPTLVLCLMLARRQRLQGRVH